MFPQIGPQLVFNLNILAKPDAPYFTVAAGICGVQQLMGVMEKTQKDEKFGKQRGSR